MRRFLKLVVAALAGGIVLLGAALWWLNAPAQWADGPLALSIEPGMTAQGVATAAAAAGAPFHPTLLHAWFRLSGKDRRIKAGSYELESGVTPRALLAMLIQGDETMKSVTLVEGWTFRQMLQALRRDGSLRADSDGLTPEAIMTMLGRPSVHPEGRFYPDTYNYSKGSSDFALLRRAMRAMDRQLGAAWERRAPGIALRDAEQALILASIVEKETGRAVERTMISSVFNNRLKIGMMLQTDPTVIYGLGERFDGNLRKVDLQTDTPWNTYTRSGLPPTPIAMPGAASLLAAVQPAASGALYFVARGDGSSEFSNTMEEHNRAVNRYQRKK